MVSTLRKTAMPSSGNAYRVSNIKKQINPQGKNSRANKIMVIINKNTRPIICHPKKVIIIGIKIPNSTL